MIIVWGTQLYGRVDAVPGLGKVATSFGHFMFLPLIPTQSYFVLEERHNDYQGIPLGLSMKSVAAGYGFPFLIMFILAGFGALNLLLSPFEVVEAERVPFHISLVVLGALAIPFLIVLQTPWFRKADYETACELAALTGDDRVKVYVDHQFGKISDEEADKLIETLESKSFHTNETVMPTDDGVPMYVPDGQPSMGSYHSV